MKHPMRRLEDMVPGLQPGMMMDDALKLIADKMEVLMKANQIRLLPFPGAHTVTPRQSKPIPPGRYEFAFPAHKHEIEVWPVPANHTPMHPNWIDIAPHGGQFKDFILEGDNENTLCVKPFSYPTSGQAIRAFHDAQHKQHLDAHIKALGKKIIDESHNLPLSNLCDHDFRPSDSVPGKNHWCSKCGERK